MRTTGAYLLLVGLALAGGSAAADQNDPRLPDLFGGLEGSGDYAAAREIEQTIWQIWFDSEDDAVTLLMADGVNAMSRSDYRRALSKFDQIVAIAPDFAEGWNRRATVNYLIGAYEESLRDIEKTLALEPRHFGALSGQGLVYLALEKPVPALAAFEAALEVYPSMPGARRNAEALRRYLQDRAI